MNTLSNHKNARDLSIKDAAELLNVTTKTLRRWEERGILIPSRTSGGHRRYSLQQIESIKSKKGSKATLRISSAPKKSTTLSEHKYEQIYTAFHIDQLAILRKFAYLVVSVLFVFVSVRTIRAITPEPIRSTITNKLGAVTPTRIGSAINNPKPKSNAENQVLALTTSSLDAQSFNVYVETNLNRDVSIVGNLNLEGDSITSANDLSIDPGGGGVLIGTETATIDLAEGDLFVSDEVEIGGSLTLGGDTVSDLTGTGLQVTANTLETLLGESIDSNEIDDDTIAEVDLAVTNTPSDNQILSYDSATGTFTWVTDETGDTSLFTDGGSITYLTSETDDFAIGGSSSSAALFFDESAGDLTISGDLNVNGDDIISDGATLTINAGGAVDIQDDLTVDSLTTDTGGVTITSGQDLAIGSIGLNDTGSDEFTSGATLVGVYATELANSSASNLQDVLDDLDAAIGGGASKFSQDTGFVYLTNDTDEVVIGGSSSLSSKLAVDGDADETQLLIQANATQTSDLVIFEQSDGTDVFNLTNAGALTLGSSLTVNSDTIDDFTGDGLTLSSNDLTVQTVASADGLSSTTSNGSGLEVFTGGIGLLQGCDNGEVLKWNEAGDLWECSTDSGASSAVVNVAEDGSVVTSIADTLDFQTGFDVAAAGSEADITLDFTELDTLTWGSGSGFTWTFDAGATDPSIDFASDDLDINVALTTFSGNIAVEGTTIGLNNDADADNLIGLSAAAGQAGSDLYWGDDLVCDVSESNCGWATGASAFSSWTVEDDDADQYSIVDSNVLAFTSSDGNILTNLTNGDDTDENLEFSVRLLGDVVAGSGLTGGADDVLVGADGDTTFNIGDGDGITVNADDIDVNAGDGIAIVTDNVTVDEDFDFAFTGNVSFTPAGSDALDINLDSDSLLTIDQTFTGTTTANSTTLSLTNSSTSGTQNGLYIDNTSSTGTTESLFVLDNSDTDTAVTNAIQFVDAGGGFTNLFNVDGTLISASEFNILDDNIALGSEVTGTLPLANGGTGASLSDPGSDQIFFWDDGGSTTAFLAPDGTSIEISGTTLQLVDGSSQASVNNSGTTVIQDVTLDTYGRVTGLTSVDLSSSFDNYSSWTFATDGTSQDDITSGDELDFVSGSGITVSRSADDQLTFTATDTSASNELQDLWDVFTADSGSTTANSQTDSFAISGGINGIDTAISGDAVTLNLDTTEIGTTTFGSGSGFTWNFDAGTTDPSFDFADDDLDINVALTTFSGNGAFEGTTIGLNNDADADNLLGLSAAAGQAGSDLYWGDDIVCDVSESNCGWAASSDFSWTDSGTTVYLTDTTDELVLGGSSPLSSAKLSIDGDADQIQLLVQGDASQTANLLTLEHSDGTNVFDITSNGDVIAGFDQLDGTDTTNGTGSSSTSLTLDDASDFEIGNYIEVASTNCTSGVNTCYAKIRGKASNTLSIAPALTWADAATVNEYHIPEIGASSSSETLTERYGRGYFITGINVGNGTTWIEDGIIQTANITGADSGDFTFTTGDTTTSGDSGDITIDTGSAADTAGTVNIGTSNTSGITIGRSGISTTIASDLDFTTAAVDIDLNDNTTDALTISEGSNNYIDIDTNDSSEAISLGNATTNPDFNFLGSGTVSIAGTASVQGNTIGLNNDSDADNLLGIAAAAGQAGNDLYWGDDLVCDVSESNCGWATSGGSSKWSVNTTPTPDITYLTETTFDLSIGGTDAEAPLFVDVSASALNLNPYGVGAGETGELRLQELEAGGDNYTGFKSPDALAGDVIYTLPNADGSSQQVLATDSLGTLSWIDVSAGAGGYSGWTLDGDSGSSQSIASGNTATIAGGTNGIDTVVGATDTVTINLDTTEIGTTTFGSGSGFTWTFDAGTTDPSFDFADDDLDINVALTTFTGNIAAEGTTIGLNNDSDVDNLLGIAAAAGQAGNDLYWGDDIVCDVSESNCGWATAASSFSSWTVEDDDADQYSIIDSNVLAFTSSDGNILTNLTNGDDTDENLDFTVRLLGDAVAGSGLTGGADNVLVGSDGDTTFNIGDGDGITVNADDIDVNAGDGIAIVTDNLTVDEAYDFAWTGQHSWTNTITADGSQADFNLTLGNDADVDTISALNIDATSATTGDADNLRALNIGNLSSADGTVNEDAIVVGTGWDSILVYNGTEIIDGSGQLVAGQLTGTLFSTDTDTASVNTIIQGDTLSIDGDSNGIDTSHSGDTITIAFDGTEVGAETWGSGSGFTWTFDAGATDPSIDFASDDLDINVALTTFTGNIAAEGTTLGLNNDADADNLIGLSAAAGQAGSDLYWGDDLVCDVSESNCGWATAASSFSSWTVEDDDADQYSIVDNNVLAFTSSDGNILTNLTNGDDDDENLDFSVRLLGDAVAGSGLTGGANDVLVGADGDTTFNIGDGDGITVNADDIDVNAGDGIAIVTDNLTVDEDFDFTFTGNNAFTPTGTDDLDINLDSDSLFTLDQSFTGTTTANSTTITGTNSSSSGTQNLLYLDNAASTGTTESLLVLDNSDTDTAVTNGIQFVDAGGGFTNLFNVDGTLISASEFTALDGGIDLASEVSGILPLANGGTGASLSDPGSDQILFWDDGGSTTAFLAPDGTSIEISGTTLQLVDGSSQASVNNSGTTVIQDVTLDTYGRITSLASVDLSSSFDNYASWTFAVDGTSQDDITSGDELDFVSGSGITVSRSADDQLTFTAADTSASNELQDLWDVFTADSGSTTANSNTDSFAISGSTNGIDTAISGDAVTLNLDTTEIGTTTFGSGSGFTWTFDAGATDPSIDFASDDIDINAALTTFSGNGAFEGTSLGLNNDADVDNLLGIAAAAGQAGSDLYWGDDLVCDVSESNCGWTTTASAFSSWTIEDDDADQYDIVDSNVLAFTSSDGNVLTNLTNGDDTDENLDFSIRLLGDAVAGSGLTGGANDVLVGADGDTTFNIGAGTGITVNADDVAVNEDYDFTFTGDVTFTPAGADNLDFNLDSDSLLTIDQAFSGTTTANSTTITGTNSSSSGTQNLLYLDNAASTGTTESLLVIDNSDTDTAVTNGIQFVDAGGGFTNLFNVDGTLISESEFTALDGGIDLASEITGVLPLANGGTGANLSDPGSDQILFWDDGGSTTAFLAPDDSSIEISGTTLQLVDGSSQASVNNSGTTVIQDVTLDTYGRVTGLTSTDLSSSFDNYASWTFAVDTVSQDAITSSDILDFTSGSGITVTRSADDQLTFTAADTSASNELQDLWDVFTADTGSATANSQTDSFAISGGTNGIDTVISGDAVTLNLDTTEIGSTTFGSGSGFTWTFDAGATDPSIDFASDDLDINVALTTFSGNSAFEGTTIGLNNDADVDNLIGLSAAAGQAGSDLYWGDDLVCDVSESNCGWSTGGAFAVGTNGAFYNSDLVIAGADTDATYIGTPGAGDLKVADDFETGDDGFIGGDLVVGASTSSTETIANGSFSLGGDDLFVAGDAGIEGTLYIDTAFDLGSTNATALTLGDGTNTYLTFDGSTDTGDTLFAFDGTSSGITSGSLATYTADTITTGNAIDFSFDGLTTGTGINISSTNTGLTSGGLMALDWSATGSNTSTADLFSINVGTDDVINSFLSITDDGSDVFEVTQAQITSAVPHQFTAAGDVSVGYDMVFTNQTASKIESYGPLTIQSGENFENNDLTLTTYGAGSVIVDQDLYVGEFTSSGTAALCWDNSGGSYINDCSGSPVSDYAEMYPTEYGTDYAQLVALGSETTTVDFVTTDTSGTPNNTTQRTINKIKPATNADRSVILGVTSRNYGDFTSTGHNVVSESDNPLPVALSGRVPVKVNATNGAINAGDPITVSSVAGVAAKANSIGNVVGTALSGYNPENPEDIGEILVFINPGWYNPQTIASLDGSGNAVIKDGNGNEILAGNSTNLSLTSQDISLNGNIDVNGEVIVDTDSSNLLAALSDGETMFNVDSEGNTSIGNLAETPDEPLTTGNVCYTQETINGDPVYTLTDCGDTPADLAEWYPVSSEADIPEAGDIVRIGSTIGSSQAFGIELTDETSDSKAIGVVSTQAHTIMGEDVLEWAEQAVPVALAGRVPVKIDPTSAEIESGDRLTSSTLAGHATKADETGYTIGNALEAWTPDSGKETILVFIENSVYLGSDLAQNTGNSDPIEESPLVSETKLESIESLLATIEIDQELMKEALGWELEDAEGDVNLTTLSTEQLYVTDVAAIESLSIGSSLVLGNDFVISSIATTENELLGTSIDTLDAPLSIQGTASQPLSVMAGKVTIDTNGNVTIAGDLLVDGSIESQSVTTDKVTISNANISEPTLRVDDEQVLGSETEDNEDQLIDISNSSIGKGVLPAGETSIEIQTTALSQNSLIYITPTTSTLNKVLYIKGQIACDIDLDNDSNEDNSEIEQCVPTFVAGIDGAVNQDIEFNWWIVDGINN